jgi:putative ABC transport system permease protein
VIAWPVTYFAITKYWLSHFPFRITIGLMIFAGAGLIAVGIALATVSFQSIKAAMANPVDSLRHE